jgi:hypothetical protein
VFSGRFSNLTLIRCIPRFAESLSGDVGSLAFGRHHNFTFQTPCTQLRCATAAPHNDCGRTEMDFRQGKHAGKSFEEVLLKDPATAQWLSVNGQTGIAKEFQKLIERFDQKPMTVPCGICGNAATKATGYSEGGLILVFSCETCDDPWIDEANGRVIRTFNDAMKFIDDTRKGKKTTKREIIRELARAKGLPKRLSGDAAIDFFRPSTALIGGRWVTI